MRWEEGEKRTPKHALRKSLPLLVGEKKENEDLCFSACEDPGTLQIKEIPLKGEGEVCKKKIRAI